MVEVACPTCTLLNRADAAQCEACGTALVSVDTTPCPRCTFANESSATQCSVCLWQLMPLLRMVWARPVSSYSSSQDGRSGLQAMLVWGEESTPSLLGPRVT